MYRNSVISRNSADIQRGEARAARVLWGFPLLNNNGTMKSCCQALVLIVSFLCAATPVAALPVLGETTLDSSAWVVIPGISFGLSTELAWPVTPPENSSDLYYQVSLNGATLVEGSTPIADDDGNFITSLAIGDLKIDDDGRKALVVKVGLDSAFTEVAETEYEAWVVIGGLTILPPIVAILLAFTFGDVLLALFMGTWMAAFIVAHYNPFASFLRTLDTYITNAFATDYRIQIIMLSWFMAGMVAMLYKAGGGHGLAELFARAAKTRRGVQLAAFGLGCLIFFDDYSSCLLVGMTMRPLTDSMFISREKLAYLVHSTSAPVASLFPITSWIGFEISLIAEAYDNLISEGNDLEGAGWELSPFMVFVKSIPSRYYPLFVLFFQMMLIIFDREFGPMLRAERRAINEGKLCADDAHESATALDDKMEPEEDTPHRWWNGLIPIVSVIFFVILGLCLTGRETAKADGLPLTAVNIFGNGDSFRALLWGSFGGVVICFVLFLMQHKYNNHIVPPSWLPFLPGSVKGSQPLLTFYENMHWFTEGIKGLTIAVLTLILAWSIGYAMEACGTGLYVSNSLKGNIDPGSIPVLTFVLAAVISFATGTSWGTMAILFPIAVPTQFAAAPFNETLMILTVSAILAGSIFGDHTTLISDTCILSCLASKCDIRHHVRTQFPYALLCALIAAILGYLPVGMSYGDFPSYAGLLVGGFVVVLIGYLISVKVTDTRQDPLSIAAGKCSDTISSCIPDRFKRSTPASDGETEAALVKDPSWKDPAVAKLDASPTPAPVVGENGSAAV